MSEVALSIGGRAYRVACADGEEAHLQQLGAMIDERLKTMGGNLSPQESQNLLFGALLIADELHETKAGAETIVANAEGQQAALAKMETETVRLREAADLAEKETERLRASQSEWEKERDTLRKKVARKDELLDRADAQMAELKAAAAGAGSSQTDDAPPSEEENLAPALERFADLLENCADKLEGKAAAS
ncbi:MAG: cell division protein ZapA [Pontixanthobacter sp.]